MTVADYEVGHPSRDLLGEAPYWDSPNGRLLRVDMRARCVHAWHPAGGASRSWQLPHPSSIAIAAADGALLVSSPDAIALLGNGLSTGDGRSTLCRPPGLGATVVLNDGKCDPAGRLWIGSYCTTGEASAALYRIDIAGNCAVVRTGLRSSNGLGWSPDGKHFYHVDTPTRAITVAAFDVDSGVLEAARPFVDLTRVDGRPDGMAIDCDGAIWVAMFGGGHVRRYRADGELDRIVTLPVTHPTSLAFGGQGLRTLYVTTSRHRLTPAQEAEQLYAGAVFAIAVDVAGTPVAGFGLPT